jgi:flavin-dependent dehydrogenase
MGYDEIVVGAGPGGASATLFLGQKGDGSRRQAFQIIRGESP